MLSRLNEAVQYAYKRGYRVLDDGRVRAPRGNIRTLSRVKSGKRLRYWKFNVKSEHGSIPICVHKLAAYQKFGKAMFVSGVQVRHSDNDFSNNRPDNVQLGTQLENCYDRPAEVRRAHAAHAATFRQHQYKALIPAMRKRREDGASIYDIATEFGCASSTASMLTRGIRTEPCISGIRLSYRGVSRSIPDWARHIGISKQRLYRKIAEIGAHAAMDFFQKAA